MIGESNDSLYLIKKVVLDIGLNNLTAEPTPVSYLNKMVLDIEAAISLNFCNVFPNRDF